MIETQRKRRGHQFMPTKAVMDKMPGMYATENTPADDKMIYAHYFSAMGDWRIAEMNAEAGEAFGYAKLSTYPEGAEWGYIDLAELEAVNVHRLIIVERDMYWEPKRFADVTR